MSAALPKSFGPRPHSDWDAWTKNVRDPAEQAEEGLRVIEAGDGKVAYHVAHIALGVAIRAEFQCPNASQGSPWVLFPDREVALLTLRDNAIAYFERERTAFGRPNLTAIISTMRDFQNLFGFNEPEPRPGLVMGCNGKTYPKGEWKYLK
jgi:hypothetical protein